MLHTRSVRRVGEGESGQCDEVVSRDEVLVQLMTLTSALHHLCHHHYHQSSLLPSLHQQALDVMERVCGFRVYRTPSPLGGLGVVAAVSGDGSVAAVKRGQLVGLYPGTLYLPHQPIFFQSINNSFIFRCADGILIDGNDKRISKFLYKSCCGRDRIGMMPSADDTWLTDHPINPLNVGQYVNNQSSGCPSNVVYQEVTLQPWEASLEERRLLPNLWYSNPPPGISLLDLPIRLVALVATRDIHSGEELLSDYFTVIH
ncbi:hypothetical protein Pcinc_008685 [Petrolisthes cinctipes]|uniref:SET domain-containing protein n=1 Tax=Petrolisthes cinctipes TaxID=88211 RepID=A0AAE1G8S4_PETCI|nr:hypothetical protein Pcinc_008685 [Petrolisthes cinctipes]